MRDDFAESWSVLRDATPSPRLLSTRSVGAPVLQPDIGVATTCSRSKTRSAVAFKGHGRRSKKVA
jgi:hypothetical protein